jgi:short-subunit dehydrogenase
LGLVADDLKVRGAHSVHTATMDVLEFGRHQAVLDSVIELLEGIDLVLIAHGTLPNQQSCEASAEVTRSEFDINAISTISILTLLGNYFEKSKKGTIVVISSVAGDRGRQSNYVYGAAKAAVTCFLQGLRNRLYGAGVNVLTVKPGFVDTPMTADFKKGPLWATPDAVALQIEKSIRKGRNEAYIPTFWWLIMFVIRLIPENVFKRLTL